MLSDGYKLVSGTADPFSMQPDSVADANAFGAIVCGWCVECCGLRSVRASGLALGRVYAPSKFCGIGLCSAMVGWEAATWELRSFVTDVLVAAKSSKRAEHGIYSG